MPPPIRRAHRPKPQQIRRPPNSHAHQLLLNRHPEQQDASTPVEPAPAPVEAADTPAPDPAAATGSIGAPDAKNVESGIGVDPPVTLTEPEQIANAPAIETPTPAAEKPADPAKTSPIKNKALRTTARAKSKTKAAPHKITARARTAKTKRVRVIRKPAARQPLAQTGYTTSQPGWTPPQAQTSQAPTFRN